MRKRNMGASGVKGRHFSIWEYLIVFIILGCLGCLPALMYGGFNLDIVLNRYTIWYAVYWLIISAVFCLIVAYQKYISFDKPMRELSEATKKVANGDFSVYLKPIHKLDKQDFIDAMFVDFNKMVEELGSIETLKSDFISNVSHEIKTPLAIIQNYSSALQSENLSALEQREYINTIVDASKNLSSLVTNILKLNKIENQKISLMLKEFDLCRQLCDCAIKFEDIWEKKGITFEVNIEDRATIKADESLLQIVWNNLISNALKFTSDKGKVVLKQTSDYNSITVSVIDTGCGMNSKMINRIFDKFYQGDTSHSSDGNGLGLALVSKIVTMFNGEVSVQSEEGIGSTFTVKFRI